MSRFLRYEACEKCRERGKDSRGDNLALYSDGSGHCFSCAHHVFPSSSMRWAPKVEEKENKDKRILPDDYTNEVPARCWQWLLQWGLPYSYWESLVGYSERHERLVFRVGEPLHFSLGRYISSSTDIDRNAVAKWRVWGDSHRDVVAGGDDGSITLVEDIISYNKVKQVSQAVCLFGTRLYPCHIEYLRSQHKPIIIWLDWDQRDTMFSKCSNLTALTGLPVQYVSTLKDPKGHSISSIGNSINGIKW